MARRSGARVRVSARRAIGLTALAVFAAAVTWRLRPTTSVGATTSDAAVVWGCSWLAWLLAGYLTVATAAACLAHLLGGIGRFGTLLGRLAPHQLRRLVEAAVTTTVAATIASTTTATAMAAPRPVVVSERAPLVAGSPLDWPGLTSSAPHHHDPHHRQHHRGGGADPPRSRHHADVGLVNGGSRDASTHGHEVVVQPGDTLWRIAARGLGPGASGAAITEAWHAWYQANRAVIGSNPSLIRPGQHLHAPDIRPAR